MSEEEGYENALFSEDATRGFAFIELCQKRFDCIVMNPPFGEGSEHTSQYLDDNYSAWCDNLVCSFFIRMQEMLCSDGLLGAIFDRTVFVRSSYKKYRISCLVGKIVCCADTGWGVLDANVETSCLVTSRNATITNSKFVDIRDCDSERKEIELKTVIDSVNGGVVNKNYFECNSNDLVYYPNTTVCYDSTKLSIFKHTTIAVSYTHLTLPTKLEV